MALPPKATIFASQIDPVDVVDWSLTITQGDTGLLEADEQIYSYTLILAPEAIAAGLTLPNSGQYSIELDGPVLHFWTMIDPTMQAASIFTGGGVTLGIELTIITTSVPPRTYKRTIAIPVAQQ